MKKTEKRSRSEKRAFNPLAFCCMIGILIGFVLPYFIKSLTRQWALVIGMSAGLLVGYLIDAARNR